MKTAADGPATRPPVMLIVSTEEWVALSVETLFAPRGYAVVRASTRRQVRERIRELTPDLIVISRDLRDETGIQLCSWLQEEGLAGTTTPKLILATSPWSREERLKALEAGAWDVRHLPMDGEELFMRVNIWVQAMLTVEHTREQGLLDPWTGLYNTHGLLRRMEEIGAGAGRHNRPLACVIIAMDAADAPNGSPGADPSPSVISDVADRLRTTGRASDTIGRVSDTQFVVVAPDTDHEGAKGLVNRLRKVMDADDTTSIGAGMRFGAYGVQRFRDASIAPAELLIRAADALRSGGSVPENQP